MAPAAPAISDEQRNRIEQNRLAAMQRRKAKLEERQTAVAAVIAAAEERDQAKRSRNDPEVRAVCVFSHLCFDSAVLIPSASSGFAAVHWRTLFPQAAARSTVQREQILCASTHPISEFIIRLILEAVD
jgi:hypothetical protein